MAPILRPEPDSFTLSGAQKDFFDLSEEWYDIYYSLRGNDLNEFLIMHLSCKLVDLLQQLLKLAKGEYSQAWWRSKEAAVSLRGALHSFLQTEPAEMIELLERQSSRIISEGAKATLTERILQAKACLNCLDPLPSKEE